MSKSRIGYIGVGLMGHGAAKNIVEKGYPLTIMGHRNRAPVEDLVKRGAKESQSPAEIAGDSDILFLCLPSSVEVEALVYGAGGVLEGAHAGLIVVNSTTADPNSTRCIAADLKAKGARMLAFLNDVLGCAMAHQPDAHVADPRLAHSLSPISGQ